MTELYPVRRMEVFTGAGRRRAWSEEAKAAIVAESYSGAETVCDVARRHGLAPTQLFTWRREQRKPVAPLSEPVFAPVVLYPEVSARQRPEARPTHGKGRQGQDGGIELEIAGVTMRVARGAEAKTVAAIIRALKADR